jgi:hypothetical protein
MQTFPPPYPTLTAKTVCKDASKYGTWIIDRDSDVQTILKKQQQCIEAEKDNIEFVPEKLNFPESKNVKSEPIKTINYDVNDIVDTSCENNVITEFPKISHYCRQADKAFSPLNVRDLSKKVCGNEKVTLSCINPKHFNENNRTFSFLNCGSTDSKGIYLCDDGQLSCEPCSFNHIDFERKIHNGFLNRHCKKQHGEDCKSKGLNKDKNKVYNRGLSQKFYDYDPTL